MRGTAQVKDLYGAGRQLTIKLESPTKEEMIEVGISNKLFTVQRSESGRVKKKIWDQVFFIAGFSKQFQTILKSA